MTIMIILELSITKYSIFKYLLCMLDIQQEDNYNLHHMSTVFHRVA